MSYRIGTSLERITPAQAVAPRTCYILSAFDRKDVPDRFSVLRESINDVEVSRDEYILKVVGMLELFPRVRPFDIDSKLLRDLADNLKETTKFAAQMYLMAFLLPKQDAYYAMCPKGVNIQVYMGVCAGINKQREMARSRIELIIQTLLRLELEDRFYMICRTIDSPFYIECGDAVVVAGLAHYHPPFVAAFTKTVEPFVRSVSRAAELVRLDFNVFASALNALPPTSGITARMERMIFGDEGHPEAGRIVWAMSSKWFIECLDTYRATWDLSPDAMRKLWTLCKEGKTITLLEATRPFGSSGTWISS